MHHRGLTTVLFLATIVLIAGLLTGCGDQSGSGSQQDGGSKAEQGKKRLVFKLAKKSKVTLGGKEAKLEDMKKGQQAQVEYVERNERNRARSVRLFDTGGGSQDDQGGEKTG